MIVSLQLIANNTGLMWNANCPDCVAQYISLNSETDNILGQYYITPHLTGGYKLPNQTPTGDYGEITVTKVVKYNGILGQIVYVNSTQQALENAFSQCCGSISGSIVPASLTCVPTEFCPPATSNCGVNSWNYYLNLPASGVGFQVYFNPSVINAGQAIVATLVSPTETTPAAILAWVQANWATYGTWSLVTTTNTSTTLVNGALTTTTTTQTQLTLSSTTVYCAAINVNINPSSFNIALLGVNNNTFNQVNENGNTTTLSSVNTLLNTSAGATATAALLQQYLNDGAVTAVTSGGNWYLNYTGVGQPTTLALNGTTTATWAAGVAP